MKTGSASGADRYTEWVPVPRSQGTLLPRERVRTIARMVRFFLSPDFADADQAVVREVLKEALRKLHDNARSGRGRGKWDGHSPWSEKAEKAIEIDQGRLSGSLRHEHAVPIAKIVNVLMENKPTAALKSIEEQIIAMSVIAIISVEEDKMLSSAMPDVWTWKGDPWVRYKEAALYANLRFQPIVD